MAQEPHLLLALFAPGSVESDIGRIQNAVFSDHGLLSSIALSPLIPVAFLPPRTEAARAASLGRRGHSPYVFATRGLSWEDGALFLRLDTGGVWAALRKETGKLFGADSFPGPFEPREGFFLGCLEAREEERGGIRPESPELRFSSCAVAVVSLSVSSSGAWWREVHAEVLAGRPLR